MADQELAEILSEYQNLAESEHQSFVSGLLHSATFAATVFSALQIYEVRGPVLWHLNDLLRFQFRLWKTSVGSVSGFGVHQNLYRYYIVQHFLLPIFAFVPFLCPATTKIFTISCLFIGIIVSQTIGLSVLIFAFNNQNFYYILPFYWQHCFPDSWPLIFIFLTFLCSILCWI
jgi:hypothetical protein